MQKLFFILGLFLCAVYTQSVFSEVLVPLGADISNGNVDMVFFFWDPMSSHVHDVDIKALLRICNVYNIPVACNRSTADFLISSPLFNDAYEVKTIDYAKYLNRHLDNIC